MTKPLYPLAEVKLSDVHCVCGTLLVKAQLGSIVQIKCRKCKRVVVWGLPTLTVIEDESGTIPPETSRIVQPS